MTRIRKARAGDHAALSTLFAEYARFYRLRHSSAQIAQFVRQRLRDRPLRTWVAMTGRGAKLSLVGFVQVYPTVSTLLLTKVWVLNDLFVHTSARGQGVGRALIERVVKECRRSGAKRVDLTTQRGNRRARALYESMGFVRSKGYAEYALVIETKRRPRG